MLNWILQTENVVSRQNETHITPRTHSIAQASLCAKAWFWKTKVHNSMLTEQRELFLERVVP
jgi:hypothetical protein